MPLVVPDFDGGALAVGTRISLVVELLWVPAIGAGGAQFGDFVDCAAHTLAAGSEQDLGAKAL